MIFLYSQSVLCLQFWLTETASGSQDQALSYKDIFFFWIRCYFNYVDSSFSFQQKSYVVSYL